MPYNLLLLPLLGGYILVTYSNCAIYWSSRQAREQLLLASAVVGMLLALLARILVMAMLTLPFGRSLGLAIHEIFDLRGIGTAGLAFLLGAGTAFWINRAWPMQESGLWLYGRGTLTQLESLFMMSIHAVRPADQATFQPLPFEVLLRLGASIPILGRRLKHRQETEELFEAVRRDTVDEAELLGPIPLMLTMKDRKVYVGFLETTPSLAAGAFTHINLVVLRSGYREKDTLRVALTDDYGAVFSSAINPLPSYKVLPVGEISSASLFDPSIFAAFAPEVGGGPIETLGADH